MRANLSLMNAGQSARVKSISADDALHHRLTALGFRVGILIKVIRLGRFKGPLQVRVGSTDVILRRVDAAKISVIPVL